MTTCDHLWSFLTTFEFSNDLEFHFGQRPRLLIDLWVKLSRNAQKYSSFIIFILLTHNLETVFVRVRISNDPEFRFPQKLWCLLYKSPSEIQDISLKWSIHFFSPTPFLLKWPFLVQMIVTGNLTIIGVWTIVSVLAEMIVYVFRDL